MCALCGQLQIQCGYNLIYILDVFFPGFYLEQLPTYGKVERIVQRIPAYPLI